MFLVHHQYAGQVHLGRHLRGAGGTGHVGRVQRLVQFGLQPLLQISIGQLAQLRLDELTLSGIDMAVGLGRCHQRLENALAVDLDLCQRQAINGLWRLLLRPALLCLPVAVSLVGQHPECRQPTVGHRLAAHLAHLAIAQQ